MKPLISVIIVNYQAGKSLDESVKSAKQFPGTEIIVIDNSPPAPNLGFSKAVNLAVAKSHGRYICLLNPDAKFTPGSLAHLLKTSALNHDRAIIAPRLVDPSGTPQPSCYAPQTIWHAIKEFWFSQKGSYRKYLPTSSGPVHAAVAACWLMPRTVWDELGGLSEKFFLYFEDLDFCDRAQKQGIPVFYDAQAKVIHQHGLSASTNTNTAKLFLASANTYHGRIKKLMIDLIIRVHDLFIPPASTKKLLGIFLLYSLFVLGLAVLGYFVLTARFSPTPLIPSIYHNNFLLWSWANFDGAHYLGIAQHGYQVIAGQSQYAFFPLLPLLINLLALTGLDPYLAGHLIVLASLLGFMFVLVKWAAPYVKNPLEILWLVLLSPGTVFLMSIYTEPVFLFLTILTFYFADKHQWGRAALATALATATRVNGIFLILFLAFKLLKSNTRPLASIFYLLTSTIGLAGFMSYLWQKTGDPLAWYHAQGDWEKATATVPWVTFSSYLRAVTTEFVPDLTHLVVMIEIILTLILLYLLVVFLRQRKLGNAYKAYTIGNLALPIITGSLGSMPRFSLILFPLFLAIPALPRIPRIFIWTLFVVSSMVGIILFTRGYWYA